MLLQLQAAVAARAQALQGDVGRQHVVARAHGGIAIDPVTRLEAGGVGTGRVDAADRAGAGHHGQVEQILALAAEHLVRIGQHAGRYDVDDDLTSAERGLGDILNGEA